MGFFRQFEEFDPLTGVPDRYPLSFLPSIVERARALLKERTRDEIINAAHNVDFFIDEYFRDEKDKYVRRLVETGGWELGYLPLEARNETGIRNLLDNWPPEADDRPLDIPTSENTSEVDALKACIDDYALSDDAEFPGGRTFEYFAVLTLWLVADALKWLKWTSEPQAMKRAFDEAFAPMSMGKFPEVAATLNDVLKKSKDGVPEFVESYRAFMRAHGLTDAVVQLTHAASSAICAMDAVCYAEQLRAVEQQAEELAQLRVQLHHLSQETEALAEEKARQRTSVAAQKAAIKRHSEHHAMKAQVFEWCAVHLAEYPSLDAAAEAITGKGKLVPITFRTARGWIGEYRRQVQSARRL